MVNSAFWKDVSIMSNWYKSSAQGEWEKLAEFGVADEYWTPVSVPDEVNALVISSRIGRDTYAIFAYDTKRRQIGEMMAGHPNQDILRWTGDRDSAFRSVVTRGMRPETVWFDSAWAAIQKSVDTALPNCINLLSGDKENRVLVHSYADIDPGTWYLLDVKNGKLTEIGRRQYSIDPAKMRPMEITAYTAADGLKIPAFLTRPARASGPGPAVTRQLMRSRIGDIRDNKTEFDAVSPLRHAQEIKAPVLLMHGEDDKRVPISHGKKMKRALNQNGKSVEWVEFENAGHGLRCVSESMLYYERLGAFLEKHIGAAEGARPAVSK